MLFGSAFATKDCGDASARVERNEDLEKLYQNGLFGATAVRNGRRFPRQRVGLVPETQEPSP